MVAPRRKLVVEIANRRRENQGEDDEDVGGLE